MTIVCISMTMLPTINQRSVKEWLVDNNVPEIYWPAQSPDLNPTEQLWDELERRLRSRPQLPTSLTALATALQEEWAAIPPETVTHLVESTSWQSSSCHKGKGWAHPVLIPTAGKYVTGKVGLQFRVGVRMLLISDSLTG
jgi:hypothetical protein